MSLLTPIAVANVGAAVGRQIEIRGQDPLVASSSAHTYDDFMGDGKVSILPQVASIILKEHMHRRIEGDILLIGRQTVLMSAEAAFQLLKQEGVPSRQDFLNEIDSSTIASKSYQYLTDRSFFSMFSPGRVTALDVSDYEGAEVIHDLNNDLPREYEGIADFIFNGSCLDNLFDPAKAVKSISKMLRPGGRVIHFEHGTPVNDALLCYSPEWFFDFYAINNYADCQTFMCFFDRSLQNPWTVFRWLPFHEVDGEIEPCPLSVRSGDFVNLVVAEKGTASTDDKVPIQGHYRIFQKDMTNDIYVRKYAEFKRSGRTYQFARGVSEPRSDRQSIPETALQPSAGPQSATEPSDEANPDRLSDRVAEAGATAGLVKKGAARVGVLYYVYSREPTGDAQ